MFFLLFVLIALFIGIRLWRTGVTYCDITADPVETCQCPACCHDRGSNSGSVFFLGSL